MDIKVPPSGESISTVLVSEWLVEEGEAVEADQIVAVLETDKVNVEVPAPVAGRLEKILIGPGQEAEIGDLIGTIKEGASASKAPSARPSEDGSSASAPPTRDQEGSGSSEEGPIVSPAARRLLDEKGLKPDQVTGSGKDGRILKEDVLDLLESREKEATSASVQPKASESRPAAERDQADSGAREEVVKMTPLRRTIAQRLVQAQQTAAILSTFNEVDMSAVMGLRKQYGETFLKKHGVKLGFMSFFVKACVEALKAYPSVNAEIRDEHIVYKNRYEIGVAVGGGKGLVVPVLRDADRLSFGEVELGIRELAEKARDMKLTLAELEGGTFTISNGGVYGSMLSTPILNPPQSGILGLHNIIERPVAVDGKVEIRPMMYLALSYDHRLVDGREAVSFLVAIKSAIEDPARLLLEI